MQSKEHQPGFLEKFRIGEPSSSYLSNIKELAVFVKELAVKILIFLNLL